LLPYPPNGHQVVLPGYGHSTSFWEDQPEAGTKLVSTFFDTGRVDDSGYKPQPIDFMPELAQPSLAKGMAGTMVGLAILTVLSLLWMPLRLGKRRRYGVKTSALLRSLYPIVLGLGGWFGGVLLVITAFRELRSRTPSWPSSRPACRSGSGSTGRGSIGSAPVARMAPASALRWAARSSAPGWASTQEQTSLALITAIVGASAGANLALIGLDIAIDRRAYESVAETKRGEILDVRPSVG
jgi:hypothetical protein